ncbi:MAG: HNH endonuclease signature motif containing protein [bacterium]
MLNKDNKSELLRQVRGKSQDEVNEILAAYRPPGACRDRVTPVRVAVPVSGDSSDPASVAPGSVDSLRRAHHKPGAPPCGACGEAGTPDLRRAASAGGAASSTNGIRAALAATHSTGTASRGGATNPPRYTLETRLRVDFVASKAFMAKYQEAQALLSNTLEKLSFETVFEAALDAFLDKHSPARRHERREKRAAAAKTNHEPEKQPRRTAQPDVRRRGSKPKDAQRDDREARPAAPADQLSRKNFDGESRCGTLTRLNSSSEPTRSQSVGSTVGSAESKINRQTKRSRHIPAKTRDAVFVRDQNRCTHIGANGKQCKSTYSLQVDHIVPFAKGGTNSLSNLRLLCAKHNNHEAKRAFGAAKINAHRRRE